MHITTATQGQSLIEILFAIAIFTIGVTTIGFLIFDSFVSLRLNTQAFQARLLASEGIEAMYALNERGFDEIPSGVYDITQEDGLLKLGSTSVAALGLFRREITVDTIDEETKAVLSEVFYDAQGQEKSVAFSTVLSNWKQAYGESGHVNLDGSHAVRTASSTELAGITLEAHEDVVITAFSLQYEGEALIDEVIFGDTSVFSASTSQAVASGEEITIANYTLQAASGGADVRVRFTQESAAHDFILTLYFSDGTRKHTPIFL